MCYLFREDKLASEYCGWNVVWNVEEEGKQDKFKWPF